MRKIISNFFRSEQTRFRLRWITILGMGATLIVVATLIRAGIKGESESSVAEELWARACSGIGEALAIAAVIAYLVDDAAKRKLLREFAEDVSEHIIGRLLPSGLRERMFQYLTVDFVRSNWTVIYELKVRYQQTGSGTPEKHVELMTESTFDMENHSPMTTTYTVAYEVMKKWFEDLRAPEIKSVKVNGETVNGCLLEDDGTGVFVKLNPDHAPELRVEIPGHPESRNAHSANVHFKLAEYLGATFYTSFDALHPVVGPTVVAAKYPADELEVSLSLSFADDAEAKRVTPLPDENDRWRIERPILPGQGFVLRWRPQPSAPQAQIAPAGRQPVAGAQKLDA
ncbi:MAG TPA: hypothetical protein VFT65_05300 [Candidatus Angelobacter sp.]|nr:hypothetical protein [Candidatus Angelobacter sp.]